MLTIVAKNKLLPTLQLWSATKLLYSNRVTLDNKRICVAPLSPPFHIAWSGWGRKNYIFSFWTSWNIKKSPLLGDVSQLILPPIVAINDNTYLPIYKRTDDCNDDCSLTEKLLILCFLRQIHCITFWELKSQTQGLWT